MMAGYFLMLYGGVGFIQNKRFFSSAPKEVVGCDPGSEGAVSRGTCRWLGDRGHRRFTAHRSGGAQCVGPQLFGFNRKTHER